MFDFGGLSNLAEDAKKYGELIKSFVDRMDDKINRLEKMLNLICDALKIEDKSTPDGE